MLHISTIWLCLTPCLIFTTQYNFFLGSCECYFFISCIVDEIGVELNNQASDGVTKLGVAVLRNFDVYPESYWFWIGSAALLGFTILFNVLFTFALMYLNRKYLLPFF